MNGETIEKIRRMFLKMIHKKTLGSLADMALDLGIVSDKDNLVRTTWKKKKINDRLCNGVSIPHDV